MPKNIIQIGTSDAVIDNLLETEKAIDNQQITELKQNITTLKNRRSFYWMELVRTSSPLENTKSRYMRQFKAGIRYSYKRELLTLEYEELGRAYERQCNYQAAVIAYWKCYELDQRESKGKKLGFVHQPTTLNSTGKTTVLIDLVNADPSRCFYLGLQYSSGIGVPQSDQIAFHCFRTTAEQGNTHAYYPLGWLYGAGRGTPRDNNQALHWYQLAAELGNALAQFALAAMYDEGIAVVQNDNQAVHWYRSSAIQGDTRAQDKLKEMYRLERGPVELGSCKDYRQDYFNGYYIIGMLNRCRDELGDFETKYNSGMVKSYMASRLKSPYCEEVNIFETKGCQEIVRWLYEADPNAFLEMVLADEFLSEEERLVFLKQIYQYQQRWFGLFRWVSSKVLSEENYGKLVYAMGQALYELPLLRSSPKTVQAAIAYYQQVPVSSSAYQQAMSDLYDLKSITLFDESEALHTRVLEETADKVAAKKARDEYVQTRLPVIYASFFKERSTEHSCDKGFRDILDVRASRAATMLEQSL